MTQFTWKSPGSTPGFFYFEVVRRCGRSLELVESQRDGSFEILQDQLHTYSTRLRNLDFQEHFGQIEMTNHSSVEDFQADVAGGRDELFIRRKDLRATDEDLEDFRKSRGLQRRVSRVKGGLATTLKGLLVLRDVLPVTVSCCGPMTTAWAMATLEPANTRYLAFKLTSRGYSAISCSTLREAMQTALATRPSYLVMELRFSDGIGLRPLGGKLVRERSDRCGSCPRGCRGFRAKADGLEIPGKHTAIWHPQGSSRLRHQADRQRL